MANSKLVGITAVIDHHRAHLSAYIAPELPKQLWPRAHNEQRKPITVGASRKVFLHLMANTWPLKRNKLFITQYIMNK